MRQPLLLTRTEHCSFTVILLRYRDTQRVYRLYDFTTAPLIQPDVADYVAGKVNRANRLNLAIDAARSDTKDVRSSTVPALADGAGGSPTG